MLWGVTALTLLPGAGAHAAPAVMQVEQFDPQPAATAVLNVAGARVLSPWRWHTDLWLGFASRPLVVGVPEGPDETSGRGGLQYDRLRAEWVGAFGVPGGLQLGLAAPVAVATWEQTRGAVGQEQPSLQGPALGDLRVLLGADLLGWAHAGRLEALGLGLAAHATVWLPSGDTDRLLGEEGLRVEPRVSVDWSGPLGLYLAANLAYHIRPRSEVFSYVNDDRVRWSLAASLPLGSPALRALGVAHASHSLADSSSPTQSGALSELVGDDPVEVLAGLRWTSAVGLSTSLAAGTGVGEGIGTPAYRVLVRVGYSPAASSAPEPGERPSTRAPAGPLDPDGDGLAGADDDCPAQAEDPDGFADGDGCPEPDNDGDGVLDAVDRCPLQAETRNGHQDADGCPDVGPDADGDGIDDVLDLCPLAPELFNGVRDTDGCPEAPPPRAVDLSRPLLAGARPAASLSAAALPPLPLLVVRRDADGDGLMDDDEDCPDAAEDQDGFADGDGCPDPDDDGDGVLDGADRCPRQAETFNGYADDDGCPDVGPDADGDGVGDADDVCPLEPELRNGVRDTDGCPEAPPTVADPVEPPASASSLDAETVPPVGSQRDTAAAQAPPSPAPRLPALPPLLSYGDQDRDGLSDVEDLCPEAPEDPDGFQDLDGCPEPDDDGDRIADADDRCPRIAESPNGYEDGDGCPDVAPSALARLAGVVDQIRFRRASDVLRRRARRTLRRVARLLRSTPELSLEIRGHTDARGDPQRNRDLSRRRAAAVVRWLVAHGVAPGRLSSRGYGPDRPVATNRSARGRARNRRVELLYSNQESQP